MPLPVGPGTPYVTPSVLLAAPTGVAWSTLPQPRSSPQQQLVEQMNICMRATALVDAFCQSTLRCTLNTETIFGPDYRLTVKPNGMGYALLRRAPVTAVTGGKIAVAASLPATWTTIPADNFTVAYQQMGVYGTSSPSDAGEGGQAVWLAPGWVNWAYGRGGYQLQIDYLNGWPHTSIVANAAVGATTISVDDCTGWAPTVVGGQGATGIIFDGSVEEAVTCTAASAATGPGTLTLSTGLVNSHGTGTLLSCLPGQVQWATILFCVSQALTRGATTTTIQNIGGGAAGSKAPEDFSAEAETILHPFRRII